jgi:PAS domain S-box-containing protein
MRNSATDQTPLQTRGGFSLPDVDDRELLVALLDAAVDAIIVSDKQGVMIRANQAAAELFRYPLDQFAGRNVRVLMPTGMAERHDGFMHHHLDTGEKRIIGIGRDVEGLRGDGSVFPLHLSVGRADIEGEVAFVAILHDQTRRKAAEEAAARAERLDAIGRMTGGIAHDFNNLLTVIIGNLELLEMAETSAKSKALIADALNAAELGADLTARLMAFSRQSPARLQSIDLNATVTQSMAMLSRTIGAHCTLEVALADAIWPANTDASQLQTAILNLVINAQDAMPSGGRILLESANVVIDERYFEQTVDATPGNYVRLSISDTGQGMTAETCRRALEPFFTTKPLGKGTGLGLSAVYGFVRQAGGHMTIYSEVGQGTTISLYFPAATNAGPAPAPAQTGMAAIPVLGNGQVVLIVEDDPAVRRLSKTRISSLGFACITAPTADAAWDIVTSRDDITLVFADLVVPGTLSGYDLAKRLSAERPDIRILLTSGFSEGLLRGGRLGPEYRILRKPYRQADLATALQAVLAT